MKRLSQEEEVECRQILFNQKSDPVGVALLKLAEYNRETLRDRLETCTAAEYQEIQGEARAWRKILKYLTDRPLNPLEK